MDAKSVRNMYSNIAVTNKHTAKLHHVGSLYILTYDARKLKQNILIYTLYNSDIYFVIYCLKLIFVFTKWFLPEDDPVGSKYVGDTIRQTNEGLLKVLTLMSIFSLLAVEVQGLR